MRATGGCPGVTSFSPLNATPQVRREILVLPDFTPYLTDDCQQQCLVTLPTTVIGTLSRITVPITFVGNMPTELTSFLLANHEQIITRKRALIYE
ncbi:unnamed protein product [Lasius platythorax]|uniref:Uncharacterized protein n=1 Tax=Lasius platythorax TaxID=488582 RepID=A0AAV2P7P9_9HYME